MAFTTSTLRLEYVLASSLTPNPLNWRRHPEHQRAAIASAVEKVGFVQPLLFNERTGRLIDGHCRRDLYPDEILPVIVGSWDEAQERTILATLDPLSMMAQGDPVAFQNLLSQLDTTGEELLGLLAFTAEAMDLYTDAALGLSSGTGDVSTGVADGDDDDDQVDDDGRSSTSIVWPSDNEFGIPVLDLGMQAIDPIFPVVSWRSQAISARMAGTWVHYVDDYKFGSFWRDPFLLLASGPACTAEVNYSTHPQHPRICVLYDIYRKRWLSRFWQSKGVRILVDLNVSTEFADISLLGVPRGWRSYATRSHNEGENVPLRYEQACEHAGTDRITFLVYGGGHDVEAFCKSHNALWVSEHSTAVRVTRKQRVLNDG